MKRRSTGYTSLVLVEKQPTKQTRQHQKGRKKKPQCENTEQNRRLMNGETDKVGRRSPDLHMVPGAGPLTAGSYCFLHGD